METNDRHIGYDRCGYYQVEHIVERLTLDSDSNNSESAGERFKQISYGTIVKVGDLQVELVAQVGIVEDRSPESYVFQ